MANNGRNSLCIQSNENPRLFVYIYIYIYMRIDKRIYSPHKDCGAHRENTAVDSCNYLCIKFLV